ncbi:MAG: beta-ketoacyl-ACP synthase II [Planctomycetota bacterium]|nr:beta-ketoacyl-ACP synthase II [Planctomycetota bacterium]
MAGNRRRVVVTGLGAVTPLGVGARALWAGLLAGKSGVGAISLYDHGRHAVHIAGEVPNWDPARHMDKREAKHYDRFTQFAVAAAGEALKDSKLDLAKTDTARVGVVCGTGIGGITTIEEQKERLMERGPDRVTPFLIPMLMGNAASAHISIAHKLRGPNFCVVTACAAGAQSIGSALLAIRNGEADAMLAGGSEAAITPLGMAGFANMKALSRHNEEPQKASRPFDKERDGFVMGEGAGIVVLEELEHALKRDAKIYCELAGYGQSADGNHITAPCADGEGGVRAMAAALADAGLNADDVDYVNAHGTSTPYNDKIETAAIKQVFGAHARKLAVSSTKSMTGHTLGAAGGVEAVVAVLSVTEDKLHATINLEHPDPECDLDYIPGGARETRVRAAISNSLGFGGHNATLVFAKLKL